MMEHLHKLHYMQIGALQPKVAPYFQLSLCSAESVPPCGHAVKKYEW